MSSSSSERQSSGTFRGPNSDSAGTAVDLVTSGRVSLEAFVTHELVGFDSVDEAVEITTNEEEHGVYGPAQITL